jgi:hypothetical protein
MSADTAVPSIASRQTRTERLRLRGVLPLPADQRGTIAGSCGPLLWTLRMVTGRLRPAALILADAWLALVACSDATGPSNLPSLVGTYDVQMLRDISASPDIDTRTVGIFFIAEQSAAGVVAGTYTLALVGNDAPPNLGPASGTLSGRVTEAGLVTLTLHSQDFADVLLTGTRSSEGSISGTWGADDGVLVGTFVLRKR